MKSKITEKLNDKDPQLERSMLVIEMIARSCSTESVLWNFLYVLALYAQVVFLIVSFVLVLFLLLGFFLIVMRGTLIQIEVYHRFIIGWTIFTITAILSRIVVEVHQSKYKEKD
ncbi:hypothetical protein [Streptococcus hyointestinalis]